jgi:thymidine phosphorylase
LANIKLSPKNVEEAKTLILDVKTGNGAFMKKKAEGKELAQKMIKIGKKFGLNTFAVVTDMNTALGNCVGNSLEIKEMIEIPPKR